MKIYYTGEKLEYDDPDALKDFTLLELQVDHEEGSFSVFVESWVYLAMCKGDEELLDNNLFRWDRIAQGELEI